MGSYFQVLVDEQATLAEAKQLANIGEQWLLNQHIIREQWTDNRSRLVPDFNATKCVETDWLIVENGHYDVSIIVGRNVYTPTQFFEFVACSHCETKIDNDYWSAAVENWYEGGIGTLSCPKCKKSSTVHQLTWHHPWAFGNLAFHFLNWAILSPLFIDSLASAIGHPLQYVYGKI